MKYSLVHEHGRLIGYSSRIGYIEKHYSNPRNYSSPQKIDYRIPKFEGKRQHVFKTLTEAKIALEKEMQK